MEFESMIPNGPLFKAPVWTVDQSIVSPKVYKQLTGVLNNKEKKK